MFIRVKKKPGEYKVTLVESKRIDGKVVQKDIKHLVTYSLEEAKGYDLWMRSWAWNKIICTLKNLKLTDEEISVLADGKVKELLPRPDNDEMKWFLHEIWNQRLASLEAHKERRQQVIERSYEANPRNQAKKISGVFKALTGVEQTPETELPIDPWMLGYKGRSAYNEERLYQVMIQYKQQNCWAPSIASQIALEYSPIKGFPLTWESRNLYNR